MAASGDYLWVAGFNEQVLTRIHMPTGIVTGTENAVGLDPRR